MLYRFRRSITALILILVLLAVPARALTVEQARILLEDYYVDPIPRSVLDQPTIPDILAALGDPYTQYMDAQTYARFLASMEDSTLVGIGVRTLSQEDGLLIETVFDGPALAGGLRPGDLITAVDGVPTQGLDSAQVVAMIRGEAGTQVTITYLRDGSACQVQLTRAQVTIPTVTGQLLDDGVGLLRCSTWGSSTLTHFRELIDRLDPYVHSWLIDLRDNTGGVTQAAADVAALFLDARSPADDPDGDPQYRPLIYLRYGTGEVDPICSAVEQRTDKPLTVLVNGATASSSEAFCGMIRDFGRGLIVGERTYGKGVAQWMLDSEMTVPHQAAWFDGDCLKLTCARFYAPMGNTNDTLGVMPDLLVDEPWIEPVGRILSAHDPQSGGECFRFRFAGAADLHAAELAWVDDPQWQPAYAALLDALPADAQLFYLDRSIGRAELLDRYGLTASLVPFPDLDEAESPLAFSTLQTYGLLYGREDGLCHPMDTLSRAEFCQMLYNALNCAVPGNTGVFSDVAEDAWYADAVTAAANRRLVNGMGDGTFAPDASLTRQQLFTIMGRLARWLNVFVDYDADSLDRAVARGDAQWEESLAAYADWAKSPTHTLCAITTDAQGSPFSLLWTSPDAIDPDAPATRDDAVYLLYNLFYVMDVLP